MVNLRFCESVRPRFLSFETEIDTPRCRITRKRDLRPIKNASEILRSIRAKIFRDPRFSRKHFIPLSLKIDLPDKKVYLSQKIQRALAPEDVL